jgi:hypothetical protein
MCARLERKPGSIGRDEGLQSDMFAWSGCLSRTWSIEIVRADLSHVTCMPNS